MMRREITFSVSYEELTLQNEKCKIKHLKCLKMVNEATAYRQNSKYDSKIYPIALDNELNNSDPVIIL